MKADKINKTILTSYGELYTIAMACHDSEGNVSKDFFDWYLLTEKYFTKTGMLIIDVNDSGKSVAKIASSFDLTDPDNAEFVWYSYKKQIPISNFIHKRQDDLTFTKVKHDIKFISSKVYLENEYALMVDTFGGEDDMKAIHAMNKRFDKKLPRIKHDKQAYHKFKNEQEAFMDKFAKSNMQFNMNTIVLGLYSLLYYMTKHQPEEITANFNKSLDEETGTMPATYIYKYTGYVDLRKSTVYRPTITTDSGISAREYQRHIQKWTVRGHYRNIGGKKIWIDEHLKGQGELEKRVYGTEDEKTLNIIPKVFEVTRNVGIKNEVEISVPAQPISETIIAPEIPRTEPSAPSEIKRTGLLYKIWTTIKLFFGFIKTPKQ